MTPTKSLMLDKVLSWHDSSDAEVKTVETREASSAPGTRAPELTSLRKEFTVVTSLNHWLIDAPTSVEVDGLLTVSRIHVSRLIILPDRGYAVATAAMPRTSAWEKECILVAEEELKGYKGDKEIKCYSKEMLSLIE